MQKSSVEYQFKTKQNNRKMISMTIFQNSYATQKIFKYDSYE